jgi:hypothetical protein
MGIYYPEDFAIRDKKICCKDTKVIVLGLEGQVLLPKYVNMRALQVIHVQTISLTQWPKRAWQQAGFHLEEYFMPEPNGASLRGTGAISETGFRKRWHQVENLRGCIH